MAVSITPENVAAFAPGIDLAQVESIIPGAVAAAIAAAPCLGRVDSDSNTAKAAGFILAGAIARMVGNTAAPPGVTQQAAGPFSMSMPVVVATFSEKETKALRGLCGSGKAFALSMIPVRDSAIECPEWGADSISVDDAPCGGHLPWCDSMTDYGCTCGWAER